MQSQKRGNRHDAKAHFRSHIGATKAPRRRNLVFPASRSMCGSSMHTLNPQFVSEIQTVDAAQMTLGLPKGIAAAWAVWTC